MEKAKNIFSKAMATLAIIGVFVAVCTADGSAHEFALRLGGVAAFIIDWSLTGKEEAV